MTTLTILAAQAVIAALTALLTVKLALRRFYSEQWWERRLAAYTTVVEALARMQNYLQQEFDSYTRGFEVSEERRSELAAEARRGRDEIVRAAAAGTFLISSEAADCLTQCAKALSKSAATQDFLEYLEIESAAVQTCLMSFRELAKKDLRVQ